MALVGLGHLQLMIFKGTTSNLSTCDTGEPLPVKLVTEIQKGQFVELHEFLSQPMMEAIYK